MIQKNKIKKGLSGGSIPENHYKQQSPLQHSVCLIISKTSILTPLTYSSESQARRSGRPLLPPNCVSCHRVTPSQIELLSKYCSIHRKKEKKRRKGKRCNFPNHPTLRSVLAIEKIFIKIDGPCFLFAINAITTPSSNSLSSYFSSAPLPE